MAEKSWGDLLRDHCPDLDEQNRRDREFLRLDSALTSREKLLIAMALDSIADKPAGVRSYSGQAAEAGASKEQILDVLRIVRMFGGRPALVTGCEALRQFDQL